MTDLTPLGALLEAARARSGLSQNEAAKRAGISGTTWRNVVRGYAEHGGSRVPAEGRAQNVASMARVVGVRSFQLREVDRADAAEALQDSELDQKHGGKSNQELLEESEHIALEIQEILRKLGRDLDARQQRIVRRWAHSLIETLAEFDQRNEVS
jgi:transcriptional regulator with XRE-family HTH domain